ncbi:hypothetical protein Htur_5062 (plasmid) [Haloterrigena turkmenica DSM 5511]|uniref:Uncharacterized protein n=1 Tax=Haloterrigena turkmenica (strain ATCC 51198 / DSM 5511 / JCM 9101 / NCIMB 13204 / VKM B-1734 / 4k) TaxID=543526 RepID=D2S3K2_HALTV|nr:hypothetical protein [Haloterrigena turkmenica]ADB63949.1 hypothetical protein Htur_5062 [Haloterrigena turkmenica DSM 5511]
MTDENTVPTPAESELTGTLETVAETETAYCRLCDEPVISGADNWGDVLEALADHGIEAHDLPEDEPWTNEMLAAEGESDG